MIYNLSTPLEKETIKLLNVGDVVNISGTLYTARDAAHKRMVETILLGQELPFDVENQLIYYVGPCPHRDGQVIGSAGPTTSSRMDKYTPYLIELGLSGMVGKGMVGKEVLDSMLKYGAVYFGAIGGAAALLAKSIIKQEIVAYPELETEAIRKLTVVDFPTIVLIDCHGNNLYEIGKKLYMVNRNLELGGVLSPAKS